MKNVLCLHFQPDSFQASTFPSRVFNICSRMYYLTGCHTLCKGAGIVLNSQLLYKRQLLGFFKRQKWF